MCQILAPVLIVNRLLFFFFFLSLRPFTELLKQTRQALSSLYYLDVYGVTSPNVAKTSTVLYQVNFNSTLGIRLNVAQHNSKLMKRGSASSSLLMLKMFINFGTVVFTIIRCFSATISVTAGSVTGRALDYNIE
jgi:hypothetical protein